jgi:uncharacterized coiled-coil protein SlyX
LKIPESFDKSEIRITPIYSGFNHEIRSVTGLTSDENNIYLMNPGSPNKLSVLDRKSLQVVSTQDLLSVKDGHSILVQNDQLLVASTGTDEILSFRLKENVAIDPKIIWKASSTKTDTHHLNSIVNVDGNLLISAFGRKEGDLNSSARNGYIHNISKDIRIKDDIYHPHSLSVRNNEIYYCESSRRSFCSTKEELFQLNGYSRGIAWLTDEIVCLTSSVGRTKSKSTGQILNPADPGEPTGRCELIIYNLPNREVMTILDLLEYGPETYDILHLDSGITSTHNPESAFLYERKLLNNYYEETKLLNTQVNNKTKIIEKLKIKADENNPAIENLRAELINRDQRIQKINAALSERDQRIQKINAELIERDQKIQNLRKKINDLKQDIENCNNKITDQQNEILYYSLSKSWRITRPLRKLMRIIRGKKDVS